MTRIKKVVNQLDKLNSTVRVVCRWSIFFMISVTFVIVVLRYILDLGWVWMQESVIYAHGFVFLASIAPALALDKHVRVDIFYSRLTPKNQAWINILGSVIFLIPTCLVILYVSYPYVMDSWSVTEGSKDSGGLHFVYLQKSLILLFCVLTLMQSVRLLLMSIQTIQGNRETS